MKDLDKLVSECKKELDAIGIPYGAVRSWSVNTRAKSRWGQCMTVSKGLYDISISYRLLQDDADDTAAKDTIIHELLHTAPGCNGHQGRWKMYADMVNKAYPQYNIKRVSSEEEMGLKKEQRDIRNNYKIVCTGCGSSFYRQRAGRIITHPELYRCVKCGGRFRVYRIEYKN